MKASKRILAALIFVVVVVVGIVGYSIIMRTVPPPEPTVLVIGDSHVFANSFDPAVGWVDLDAYVQRACYDTLVEYTPDLKVVPALATSWTASPDAKEWVFELRKDVHFQDGSPLNASAVKFSIERSQRIAGLNYYYTSIVKSVEVLGPYELKITLNDSYAGFIDELTWPAFSVVNPTVVTQKGDDWLFDHCAGSGRWNMTEFVKGERTVFVANKNHWDPPKVDKLIDVTYPDATSLIMALRSGTVDAIQGDIAPNDLVSLKEDPNFNVYQGGGAIQVLWSFSFADVPDAANLGLRRAIASAIDREAALDIVFNNTVTPLYSIIPTYFDGYVPAFKTRYPHDLTMAKQYLAEAGFPQGTTIDLSEDSHFTLRIALYQVLKQQLAEVGITLNIRPMESSAWYDACYNGGLALAGNYWGPSYNDPDEPLGMVYSVNGPWMCTFYNNSRIDQLYLEQRGILDQTRRRELFREIQELVAEDVPLIPLYHFSEALVAKKQLLGLVDTRVHFPSWWHLAYFEQPSGQALEHTPAFTLQIAIDLRSPRASDLHLKPSDYPIQY